MNPDNPFSSGPGKAAPKTEASEPVPVPREPVAAKAVDDEVVEVVKKVPAAVDEVAEVVASVQPVAKVRPAVLNESGELPPLEMDETSCRTCQFFQFEGDARVAAAEGECRYNAPTPGLDERAQWPIVDWNSWCGQWNTGISNDDMVKMARVVADRMTDPGAFTD